MSCSDLKGVFYLRTNEHSKYGKGTDGISEELKKAKKKARQAHNEQVLSKIIRSSIDDKRKTLIRKLTYSKKKSIKSWKHILATVFLTKITKNWQRWPNKTNVSEIFIKLNPIK